MHIIPTILCGGAGSRLWPVSRDFHPKPFIQLQDGQSLLQKAFLRGAAIPGVKEILTVTNQELFFKTQDVYREINEAGIHASYLLEPFGKNTAAAIATAALHVASRYGNDAILLILAADHLITDQDAFQQAVDKALLAAKAQRLVAFGIQPTHAETGYGYIEFNSENPQVSGLAIERFIEKPNKEKAEAYIAAGTYLWNSGMFCFTAGAVLERMHAYCPEILAASKECLLHSSVKEGTGFSAVELESSRFAQVPENSFDYAVMEPASHHQGEALLTVVPCDIGWSDIGSWSALGNLSAADELGNRVDGQAVLYATKNCYIKSTDRLVGAVGLENVIIIDTPDALLVADDQHAQDVKQIYMALKEKKHDAYKLHRTVHRPWGTFTILEEGSGFKIKRIEVKPGASLSLQMHHHRSEHWIVVSGMARVTNGDDVFLVGTNQSTYIPAGNKHRLENPGVLNLVMIEVQSGEYLGEDDIFRFEDNYGRA